MQALTVALATGAIPPRPVLYRLPGLSPMLQSLYAAAGFARVETLPWEAATPDRSFQVDGDFCRRIDMRDFAFDPAFRGVSMIDYFLERLGVPPGTVPGPGKRNAWLSIAVRPARCAVRPGYILLCPKASMALRDMPPRIERAAADWLGTHCRWEVVRQWPAGSIAELCGQVAGAALVVSTDTAAVHLADAYSVPCLAFFPTHEPVWRVRDYPFCQGVRLAAPALEPAQEFARGEADLAAARAAWFPDGRDLTWLFAALRAALDAA